MKRLSGSIKARITLWCAALLLAICAAAMMILVGIAEYSARQYCGDTLHSAAVVLMDEMEIEHGLMEIDSDLEDVPNVYAALFEQDGSLIYGRLRVDVPFEDGVVRRVDQGGHRWFILDTLLSVPGREETWLRLHTTADVHSGVYRSLAHYGAWLVPLLAVIALLGGYLITARAFRPVKDMTQLAASIADGGDLTRRIEMPSGRRDELHALADTMNEMLERLQMAFEHERQFTSDAAHELRTPLNAMRTQAEYALSRTNIEEKDEAIACLLERSEGMHALVRDLLMIARMDAGQLPMKDLLNMKERIACAAEDMMPVAEEKRILLQTALEDCCVEGNRAMLTRLVINLIDNAIRYGKEGGTVRIGLTKEAGCAVLTVEDDGCGIAPQDLPHVFDRFWRADSARSSSGTGIGLAIVRAGAQAHGGSAQVRSSLGEGSCFTIRIPAAEK